MSSFRRKSIAKQRSLPAGTRQCPSSPLTALTSTGVPSLDDILGGGLPLSCSLLVFAPDHHSAYGELLQKYFIAQGLASGQDLCVIHDNATGLVKECMWMPGTAASVASEDEDDETSIGDDKVKIAWRYEQMKKFQTTVPSPTVFAKDYCRTFDLTCRVPDSVVEAALNSGQLICLDVNSEFEGLSTVKTIHRIEQILGFEEANNTCSSKAIRICIPSFGSPQWGDLRAQEILRFLHSLRRLLRQYPHACACVSLPPNLSSDAGGGAGWTQKAGWLSDAAITLSAFSANPSLSENFPAHHGFVQIHTLPAPHTILPPSDKFSTLRGLSSSAVSTGSSGENNLAFKCMRKRMVFETLHLDLDGGVGERRTTPSTTAMALDAGMTHQAGIDAPGRAHPPKGALPTVEVKLEAPVPVEISAQHGDTMAVEKMAEKTRAKRTKKKVAFQSERPELYDF